MSDDQVPFDKVMRAFLKVRDRRAELKKEYEAEDAGLKEAQEALSGHILNIMNTTGIDKFTTKYGTAYKSEAIKPHVIDWDALYKYVDENKAFDIFEKRVKTTYITSYMEQNDGDAPPGVSVYRQFEANVRRKN